MSVIDDRIIQALDSADRQTQLQGLKEAGERLRFAVLPAILPLMASQDAAIAQSAKEIAVSTATIALKERRKPVPSPTVQAAVAVIRNHIPEFIDQQLAALQQQGDVEPILDAIFVLRHFLNETAARMVLGRFIAHPDKRVRATVVLQLGAMASKTSPDVLTAYMNDGDNRVKANAVEVIERLGNKKLTAVLNRFRRDENNRIRANVLKALSTLGKIDIAADLEAMLKNQNPLMRTSAVWVIGELGDKAPQYLSLLTLVVDDEFELLRDNIRIAMRKVSGTPELALIRQTVARQDRETLRRRIASGGDVEVRHIQRESYLLVKISGTMKAGSAPSMRLRLEELITYDGELVLDLGMVDFIDSAGISLLINMAKRIRERGHIMYICNSTFAVSEAFQLTGLDQELNVFLNEQEIRDFIQV